MRILIKPGETLHVGFADSNGYEEDGEFVIRFTSKKIEVSTKWPDTSGREGVIYREEFDKLDPEIGTIRPLWQKTRVRGGLVHMVTEDRRPAYACGASGYDAYLGGSHDPKLQGERICSDCDKIAKEGHSLPAKTPPKAVRVPRRAKKTG